MTARARPRQGKGYIEKPVAVRKAAARPHVAGYKYKIQNKTKLTHPSNMRKY